MKMISKLPRESSNLDHSDADAPEIIFITAYDRFRRQNNNRQLSEGLRSFADFVSS